MLKVNGSNSGLCKYVYFVKKLYIGSIGACGGDRLATRIFFLFYSVVFKPFLIFFLFRN